MKYSTSMIFPPQTSSKIKSRFFDTQPLSRVGVLERKNRRLSVACYFGLAPFLWFSGVIRQQNRLVNHHLLYSLAFSFTLLCAFIFDWVTTQIQYWITSDLWNPTMAEFRTSVIPMWMICKLMVFGTTLGVTIFGLAWLAAVIGAGRGRTPHIPIIASITSNSRAVKLGVVWSLVLEFLILFFIGIGLHSIQIASRLPQRGDVYVLYPRTGYIPFDGWYENYTPPPWMITMAFYPLVRAGLEKYGDQGVSVLPLSKESFNRAIQDGKFIFVASHGGYSPGSFTISSQPYQEFTPSDVDPSLVGEQLQYMYFGGCWTGFLESDWRRVLGLDNARMFNRLSYVEEHLRWIWFRSPAVIAGLN